MSKDKRFAWRQDAYSLPGFTCALPEGVTISAYPLLTSHFGTKPKRGSKWSIGASQWDGRCTISRFGTDTYGLEFKTAKEAMRAAELHYLKTIGAQS